MTRRRARALLVALALLPASAASAQSVTLQDISPGTASFGSIYTRGGTGGRVNGVAIDPHDHFVMYAASEWGGIYKSVDGGDQWLRLTGHRPMVTWDVEVNPGNSNIVYATSLYDGRNPSLSGINVSFNGGLSWTHPPSATPSPGRCANLADQTELSAFGIAIDRSNPQRVYIGTSCGVAISTDAGFTWHHETPPSPDGGGRVWDVVSAVSGVVDLCGDEGHFFFELDTLTWGEGIGLPSGVCSIASSPYYPSTPNLFAVVGTQVFETTDRVHWTQTRTNPQPQGRIPFVETNKRSFFPGAFDLWFGDVLLWRVTCDANVTMGPRCGTGNVPAWSLPMVDWGNGFGDQGALAFDPYVSVDACPLLNSADAGVVVNDIAAIPDCQTPAWKVPTVTPRGLWPWSLSGVDVPGSNNDHLYLGTQDNGILGNFDAGAGTPSWSFATCCDVFDILASPATVTAPESLIFSFLSPAAVYRSNADFSGLHYLDMPAEEDPDYDHVMPSFTFPDAITRFGEKSVAVIKTWNFYTTTNIEASAIDWQSHGGGGCAVYSATNQGARFYIQNGGCNGESVTDQLWRFDGTWTLLTLPNGGGFGIVAVDPSNANRLIASGLTATDARMYLSLNGGVSWQTMPALDQLMRGNGTFPIKNQRGPTNFTGMDGYHQPSFAAFDPFDPDNVIAGGRDSGIFLSRNGGTSWTLVTDPRDSDISGVPHIPRPKHAYFSEADHDKSIYVSSQGGGVWRLGLCDGDAFEPDDAAPSLIESNNGQARSLCATGDVDLVSFTLAQSSSVSIVTGGYQGSIALQLRDSQGNLIAQDDDGGVGLSRIDRTCAGGSALPAGTYTIRVVVSAGGDIIPSYSLSLSAHSCCAGGGPPAAVENASMTSTLLQWTEEPTATGYDVIWGDLLALRESNGDFSMATGDCYAVNVPSPEVNHLLRTPFPGEACFFLIRGTNSCAPGTFDDPLPSHQVGLRDAEIEQLGLPCLP